jgi:phosphinothricin acetyltransferase
MGRRSSTHARTPTPDRARTAHISDAEAIARIYAEGIADRVATFETEGPSADQVRELLEQRSAVYPAVVVERHGEVVAFAWTSLYRARDCYSGVAEFSVYVARPARGTGAGQMALKALFDAAEQKGFWKLVSRVFPENAASRALCRATGFREVGVYRNHGKLDGEWRDCVIVEKLLGEAARAD